VVPPKSVTSCKFWNVGVKSTVGSLCSTHADPLGPT
jgi:hypothetical protein